MDDDLIESYRQASAQQASRPSDATRAAIAAKARELAAQRRESAATAQFDTRVPAANQSSWKIRAVAGLALLTVGGSLFWQVNRDYPQQLPTTVAGAPESIVTSAAPAAERAADVATEQKAERDAARRRAPASAAQDAVAPVAQPSAKMALESKASAEREEARADAAPRESALMEEVAAAAPAAEAPASAGSLSNLAPAPAASSPPPFGASRQGLRATQSTGAASVRTRPDANDIMMRYFADTWMTGEAGLWVLLDVRGGVLRTGRQAPTDPTALRRYLAARYADIIAAEVETVTVNSQRGNASIRFVWLAPGSPLPGAERVP